MTEVPYDDIFLNITSRLDTRGLNSAVNALKGLQSITGFSGLKQAGEDLKGFINTLNGLSARRMKTLTDFANSIKGVGGIGKAMKAVAKTTEEANPMNDISTNVAPPPVWDGVVQKTEEMKSAMQETKKEAIEASKATKEIGNEAKKVLTPMEKLAKRFKSFLQYRMMRDIWNGFIQGAKEGVKNLEDWDRNIGHTGFADSMDRARASLTMLKNSLAVITAPALEWLIGILQRIASWAIVCANAISRFMAIIGGKSSYRAVKSIDAITTSENKAGASAKKATAEFKKQLMGFDEINNITAQNDNGLGGGGGAGVSGGLSDMFEELPIGELNAWDTWWKNAGEAWRQGVADLKDRLATAWEHIKGWGATVKQFFSETWNGIKIIAKSVWEKMKEDWQDLKNFAQLIWNGIKTVIGGVAKAVLSAWEKVKAFFDQFFASVKAGFQIVSAYVEYAGKAVGNFWDLISGKQSLAEFKANMEEAKNVLDGKVKKATDDLRNSLENTFNRKWYVKTVWDEIINRTVHVNEIYTAIGSKGMRTVEKYASGGIVPQGQLFIAREAGAELVGNVGGHTAVMNNQDIVGAVSQGVASAVASVMGGGSNVTVTLEGDAKGIFKVVQKEGRAYSARTGQPALA